MQEKVARQGHAARSAAVRRLIDKYEEEFDGILREERESRGLLPQAKKRVTIKELQDQLEAANQRIKELEHNQ